jgi:hypothetical protein
MSRQHRHALRLELPETGPGRPPRLPLLEEWLPEDPAAEIGRAGDDGFPHLPLLEEWLPKDTAKPGEGTTEEGR